MHSTPERTHFGLGDGARCFVLLAVVGAVLWTRESDAVTGLAAIALIWTFASLATRTRVPRVLVLVAESVSIATVAGISLDVSPALLAAIAVPPFTHGLSLGLRGALGALAIEVIVLATVVLASGAVPAPDHAAAIFTWVVSGLGLGLVATFFVATPENDSGSSAYREAHVLLQELNEISSQLVGGLDPTSLAGTMLDHVGGYLPLEWVSLLVERGTALNTLADRGAVDAPAAMALAREAWPDQRTVVRDQEFSFVLQTSGAPVAVVAGRLGPGLTIQPERLRSALDHLRTELDAAALRLDTSRLFEAFRATAMSQERQRLAREMHDGMAQDIASMGYVVDALISTATPIQEKPLHQLRSMITEVVAEIRRSVLNLRTEVGASESLGAAIATQARHLSDVSGLPIEVTVDERTDRLRYEVEAELLRIAQEAMNNAVRHSGAQAITVQCRVEAPHAYISVQDNGLGLKPARRDSHGLAIMHERASLIGAELSVSSGSGGGTRVSVTLGDSPEALQRPATPETDRRSP